MSERTRQILLRLVSAIVAAVAVLGSRYGLPEADLFLVEAVEVDRVETRLVRGASGTVPREEATAYLVCRPVRAASGEAFSADPERVVVEWGDVPPDPHDLVDRQFWADVGPDPALPAYQHALAVPALVLGSLLPMLAASVFALRGTARSQGFRRLATVEIIAACGLVAANGWAAHATYDPWSDPADFGPALAVSGASALAVAAYGAVVAAGLLLGTFLRVRTSC